MGRYDENFVARLLGGEHPLEQGGRALDGLVLPAEPFGHVAGDVVVGRAWSADAGVDEDGALVVALPAAEELADLVGVLAVPGIELVAGRCPRAVEGRGTLHALG
jgi:hypothetical protein